MVVLGESNATVLHRHLDDKRKGHSKTFLQTKCAWKSSFKLESSDTPKQKYLPPGRHRSSLEIEVLKALCNYPSSFWHPKSTSGFVGGSTISWEAVVGCNWSKCLCGHHLRQGMFLFSETIWSEALISLSSPSYLSRPLIFGGPFRRDLIKSKGHCFNLNQFNRVFQERSAFLWFFWDLVSFSYTEYKTPHKT